MSKIDTIFSQLPLSKHILLLLSIYVVITPRKLLPSDYYAKVTWNLYNYVLHSKEIEFSDDSEKKVIPPRLGAYHALLHI